MKNVLLALSLFLSVAFAQDPATSNKSEQTPAIDWQDGPTVGELGTVGQLNVPEGFRFTGRKGAQKLLELTQNPTNGKEMGALVPFAKQGEPMYFVIFEYDEIGYVKDDDKDKLNADALISSIKEATEESNKVRQEHGWESFHVVGWEKPPFYDPVTHNLTWAIRGKGTREESINYSTRILGRHGTMNVDLVAGPGQYAQVLPVFNEMLAGYKYTDGNRYTQFVKGDKVAEYGLTALVAGGAGAAAAKLGLFGKLWKLVALTALKAWKLILAAVAGLTGLIKKLFGRKTEDSAERSNAASAGE